MRPGDSIDVTHCPHCERPLTGPSESARRAPSPRLFAPLSRRQREIAHLAASGVTNGEIARHLHLAEKTVEYHLTAIYRRTNARSRTHLARLYFAERLALASHPSQAV